MNLFKKLAIRFIPIIFSVAFFLYIVIYTKPPATWQEASVIQILSIFIPILVFSTFMAFVFTSYLPVSFLVGVMFTLLFVVKVNGGLSWLVGSGIVLSFSVLIYLFNRYRPNVKIPKFKSLMKKKD